MTAGEGQFTEEDMARLWRKLSDNQRLYLMNQTAPPGQRCPHSDFIVAARALRKHGLEGTVRITRLTEWARAHGYARQDGPEVAYGRTTVPTWTFSLPPRQRRVDSGRLAQLVADGHQAAAIAEHLAVSRQAVYQALSRDGLTLAPRPKKPNAVRPPRAPRAPRALRPKTVAFKVSESELKAIQEAAARQSATVAAYLRGVAVPGPR